MTRLDKPLSLFVILVLNVGQSDDLNHRVHRDISTQKNCTEGNTIDTNADGTTWYLKPEVVGSSPTGSNRNSGAVAQSVERVNVSSILVVSMAFKVWFGPAGRDFQPGQCRGLLCSALPTI